LQIRNGTAEFLIFSYQTGGDGVEVRVQDGTIWLSQKNIASLFDTSADNISLHLKNIYSEDELNEKSTTEDFSVVQIEGTREVKRNVKHYNLDAIIAVGYRVNSKRATAFRQWATGVLRDYALRGYLLDRKRMENGAFLNEDYFEHLLEEIREIRLSERRFYQKITDIYSTAMDYDKNSPITQDLVKVILNQAIYQTPINSSTSSAFQLSLRKPEAIYLTPFNRNRLMARLRIVAKTRGAAPVLICERSSSKVTSRTQCREFSIDQ